MNNSGHDTEAAASWPRSLTACLTAYLPARTFVSLSGLGSVSSSGEIAREGKWLIYRKSSFS